MNDPDCTAPLLEVEDLVVEFRRGRRVPPIQAVDGVTLELGRGETLGVVGESGSGKSTLANAVLGMVRATGGTVRIEGRDVTAMSQRDRRHADLSVQAVFQDPYSSLNPSLTVGQIVSEPLRARHQIERGRLDRKAIAARVGEALDQVQLPSDAAGRYPAELSTGQRQRVVIARALVPRPRLVICDEPVSSLDVSIQGQILNLLTALQVDTGISYLFISHDLGVVRHMAHRVTILYRGRVMETGPAAQVVTAPVHPYTRALLAAIPRVKRAGTPGTDGYEAVAVRPAVPEAAAKTGCPFAPRCPHCVAACRELTPPLEPVGDDRHHFAACIRLPELADLRRPTHLTTNTSTPV